ncbi:MAG: type II toxin-antitoxin system VapC family toxin [Lapillicoccus sp.]
MIVLDTSALVDYLVGATSQAERVREAVGDERLAAPHAMDLECVSVLRGLVRGGKLADTEATRAVDVIRRMPIRRYDHVPLLSRIWQLRHNMWPYDAAYIALAEALSVDVVTVDGKLAAVPGLQCTVRNLRSS